MKMKILFITNLPSPYRVDFFNELGKSWDLTVCYERKGASDRNEKWIGRGAENFSEIYAQGFAVGTDKSLGLGVIQAIRSNKFDLLILAGYSSPSVMLAIAYCRMLKIPFFMEHDGGFDKTDPPPLRILKRNLLCGAAGHFTTCREHKSYLQKLGIPAQKIYLYPFTSVSDHEVLRHRLTAGEKAALRQELHIPEKKVVLSVGQYIPRKGMDVLLAAAEHLDDSVGIYIVGGKPTPEYSDFVNRRKMNNVHFLDFMEKPELFRWYSAADVFVLPTREDIWGLVINEAMANALPVITTTRCIAGQELICHGKNGFLVPANDSASLAARMSEVLSDDGKRSAMADLAWKTIQGYTIEQMSRVHSKTIRDIFGRTNES